MVRDVATVEYGEPVSFTRGHITVAGQFGGHHAGRVIVITPKDVWSWPVSEVMDAEGRVLGFTVDETLPVVAPDLE
jgi:hypothetical protein